MLSRCYIVQNAVRGMHISAPCSSAAGAMRKVMKGTVVKRLGHALFYVYMC